MRRHSLWLLRVLFIKIPTHARKNYSSQIQGIQTCWKSRRNFRALPAGITADRRLNMQSTHLRAIPQLMAAKHKRSISRFRIMQISAFPSSPTRFSLGTIHLSKTSSAVMLARMPHLSLICCPSMNPDMPCNVHAV